MAHIHGFKSAARVEIEGAARFLTFSCFQQRPIFLETWRRWEFVDALANYARSDHIDLHAWVLMPDHVHLLLTPLRGPLGPSLTLFKLSVARRLNRDGRKTGAVWRPGGGYDRSIVTFGEFFEKREYIHRNALRAGLSPDLHSWPWHSWHELFGQRRERMPPVVSPVQARLVEAKMRWSDRQRSFGKL